MSNKLYIEQSFKTIESKYDKIAQEIIHGLGKNNMSQFESKARELSIVSVKLYNVELLSKAETAKKYRNRKYENNVPI